MHYLFMISWSSVTAPVSSTRCSTSSKTSVFSNSSQYFSSFPLTHGDLWWITKQLAPTISYTTCRSDLETKRVQSMAQIFSVLLSNDLKRFMVSAPSIAWQIKRFSTLFDRKESYPVNGRTQSDSMHPMRIKTPRRHGIECMMMSAQSSSEWVTREQSFCLSGNGGYLYCEELRVLHLLRVDQRCQ